VSKPQKYHCVTQLGNDEWVVRVKQPSDAPNCDDLVLWSDVEAALADRTQAWAALHQQLDDLKDANSRLKAAYSSCRQMADADAEAVGVGDRAALRPELAEQVQAITDEIGTMPCDAVPHRDYGSGMYCGAYCRKCRATRMLSDLKAALADRTQAALHQQNEALIQRLRREPCDSDLRACRANWPDHSASWCIGCVMQAAADELVAALGAAAPARPLE
jgi:hypothetical protein